MIFQVEGEEPQFCASFCPKTLVVMMTEVTTTIHLIRTEEEMVATQIIMVKDPESNYLSVYITKYKKSYFNTYSAKILLL